MCQYTSMRSYIYENVKLSNGKHFIRRYTPVEGIVYNIIKFLCFLFVIWPLEIFVWWPIKLIVKAILILCEIILRIVWWLIRLPFCLLFYKRTPIF